MVDHDPRDPNEVSPVVALLRRVGSSSVRPAVVLIDDEPDKRRASGVDDTRRRVDGGDGMPQSSTEPTSNANTSSGLTGKEHQKVLDAVLKASRAWRFPVVSAWLLAALLLSFAFAMAMVDGDEDLGDLNGALVFLCAGGVLAGGAAIGGWRGYRSESGKLESMRRSPEKMVADPSVSSRPVSREKVNDLWRFYDEHASQTRQNESLRATAISIMVGFAGVLAAVAGQDGLGNADIPAAAIVTVLGVLGFLLSLSHYAKSREHIKIMGVIRDEIEELGGADTNGVRKRGEQRFKDDQANRLVLRTSGWRWRLWAILPLLVAIAGVALVILSIVGVPAPD